MVDRTGVGSFQISLLTPSGAAGRKNIRRSRACSAVVRLVTIDAGGVAYLLLGSDHRGVAGAATANSETVAGVRIGSLKIGLLAPGGSHCARKRRRRRPKGRCYQLWLPFTPFALLDSPKAPTMILSPEMATEPPN